MPMYKEKLFMVLAAIFISATGPAAARAEAALRTMPVTIEVAGEVPGFSHEELAAYLARAMQQSAGPTWRFAAAKDGAAPAANRVVWSFKTLREVWKGSFHSGFPSPSHSETYLSTEAKLYLDGVYQMTMSTQPTVLGGSGDVTLTDMTRKVARAMFVENRS